MGHLSQWSSFTVVICHRSHMGHLSQWSSFTVVICHRGHMSPVTVVIFHSCHLSQKSPVTGHTCHLSQKSHGSPVTVVIYHIGPLQWSPVTLVTCLKRLSIYEHHLVQSSYLLQCVTCQSFRGHPVIEVSCL